MLEILSHQYLRRFMKSRRIEWEHIYSFGRIISKCIKTKDNYLINSEIFSKEVWISAIMISLFLNKENSIFVLSEEKIQLLRRNLIEDLKILGFHYIFENDQIIFPTHRILLTTVENLLGEYRISNINNRRIIFSGIENIKNDLKDYFRISLFKKDWFYQSNEVRTFDQNIVSTYNLLKKKFFLRKVSANNFLFLEDEEISFLSKFFLENASFSKKFSRLNKAFSKGWACWVELDKTNLEWCLYSQPIDELFEIKKFLIKNNFVFLSAMRRDNFFEKYLKDQNIIIDLVVNFKSNFKEKDILIYVPPKQLLPNNPSFNKTIIEQCLRIILFRKGLILILCDDTYLKINLATELASKYGKKVFLETIPLINNGILCSSYSWWIKNSTLIDNPEKIIITLLPLPNILDPINEITVSYNKKLSKDWFRDFLLPETIEKLEKSVSPLRRSSGTLIILDGRVHKRQWGRLILESIQPSKIINYMMPFN